MGIWELLPETWASAENVKPEITAAVSFLSFSCLCIWLPRHADFTVLHAYRRTKVRDVRCVAFSIVETANSWVGRLIWQSHTLHMGCPLRPLPS
jgi:hypothetical protein